jgi:septum site-determining protein MinC
VLGIGIALLLYAPLRGRAIAGARGWPEARIFALEMRPDLVSIAGVYRTGEEPLPPAILGQAASVRLQSGEAGDTLVFEPITG